MSQHCLHKATFLSVRPAIVTKGKALLGTKQELKWFNFYAGVSMPAMSSWGSPCSPPYLPPHQCSWTSSSRPSLSSKRHQTCQGGIPITYLTFIKLFPPLFSTSTGLACCQVTLERAVPSKTFMAVWALKWFFTYGGKHRQMLENANHFPHFWPDRFVSSSSLLPPLMQIINFWTSVHQMLQNCKNPSLNS